jgi:NAD(P)-dependent dehydrogenase (short-subunit alcohol dehydrogenase family)
MPGLFAGRSVVITGASRGIGLGIARAFAAEGAELRLIADDPAVRDAATALGGEGRVADVTDEDAVREALSGLGRIDVLVNNAGLERLTPVDDGSPETLALFRRILDINVAGIFLVTRLALPRMPRDGRVINTASVWGRVAEPCFGAYVASKHAVIGLTKTLARELGPRGITVNAVCPGWVRTEASMRSLRLMAERAERAEAGLLDEIVSHQALPGLMEPDDIAGPYLFMASPWAANITGQSLGVDRGEVPW